MDILLWIDDERQAPPGFTHHAKTSREAIEILSNIPEGDDLYLVSFDHDLSMDPEDGHPLTDDGEEYDDVRPVIQWMMKNDVWPIEAHIHTQNREGGDWLYRSLYAEMPAGNTILRLPYNRKNYS